MGDGLFGKLHRMGQSILGVESEEQKAERVTAQICRGLGGKHNIEEREWCATRLRCRVEQPELVSEDILKAAGALGILHNGHEVQVIFGTKVEEIHQEFEDQIDHIVDEQVEPQEERKPDKRASQGDRGGDRSGGRPGRKPRHLTVLTPMTGFVEPITSSPDPAFASKMLGDGFAIMPEDNKVYAPKDAKVMLVAPSRHAIGMKLENDHEFLIHIGIDTMNLDPECFQVLVKEGQEVHEGDLIMTFDLERISQEGKSESSAVILTSLRSDMKFILEKEGHVDALEEIGYIEK